jgi:hypothetical protein
MNKGFLAVVGVLVLLGIGAWYVSSVVSQRPLTSQEDALVRALITDFGTKLQMVPLLAPAAERKAAMETYYKFHVAPELIAQWAPEGAEALGRSTSSPWPERIEIADVQKTAPGAYKVEANVIEVANIASTTQVVAVYPVTFALEERGTQLLIVKMEKGPYSEIPHRQTVVGFWECLPHKAGQPTTEECALGIAVDQSDGHFALDLGLMARAPVEYDPGTKVRVEGVVTPANQLSSVQWQKYDIDGIISATTIQEVE